MHLQRKNVRRTIMSILFVLAACPVFAFADAAVLGLKLDADNQQASAPAAVPTLVGPAGTIQLTGNPYNSGFIANGTYTAYGNAPSGLVASYWLCYNQQTMCDTPNFVVGNSVSVNVTGNGQSGDHVTLWWKYAPAPNGAAVIGVKVGADNQQASAPAVTPTLVGLAGTITLTGNPFNSLFIANGTYTAHANAPAGYTASYWLCYTSCTTSNFVTGNSVSINVNGTQQPTDVVTLWWKYQPAVPPSPHPIPIIPSGITTTNLTSEWYRGEAALLSGFINMYQGEVVQDPSDAAFPYKMFFFGWANGVCNPGKQAHHGCDAIFYARSANGNMWQVYSGGTSFDSTMNPSLWQPVITARDFYFDEDHNGDPSVVKIGNTFYMAYSQTGYDLDRIQEGQPGDTDGSFGGIGGAVSTDGINWQRAPLPILAFTGEAGGKNATLGPPLGGDFERPSLLYENGKFKMWFDYADSGAGGYGGTGYAELSMPNPSAASFIGSTGSWNVLRSGDNPVIRVWPNPDVVRVGNIYYAYGDPHQSHAGGDAWSARRITEATSPDGINWTVRGYIDAEAGCAADHTPQAYYENGKIYLTYGCQNGGSPYDYKYSRIKRMSKSVAGASPHGEQRSPPAPHQVPPVPPVPPAQQPQSTTYCPRITQNLRITDRDSRTVPPGQVTELQKFIASYYKLNVSDVVTGYFGATTRGYVQRFQRENNLIPPAGFVGSITRAKIAHVCSGTTAVLAPESYDGKAQLASALAALRALLLDL